MNAKITIMEHYESLAAARAEMTADQIARLQAIAAMPDEEIDLSDPDAPEVLDWSGAVRGKFYRPRKVQKTLRIDADVLAYFELRDPATSRA